MTTRNQWMAVLMAGLSLFWLGAVHAKKLEPEENCAVQKAKISAAYFSCLFKRDFVTRKSDGKSNAHKHCDSKFTRFWTKIESKHADVNGNTLCPLAAGEESLSSEDRAASVMEALQETYQTYMSNFEGSGPVPDPIP